MADIKAKGLGALLRRLREEAGLSQAGLAGRLGWDKGRLSKYETGSLAVSFKTLDKLALALGLEPAGVAALAFVFASPRLLERAQAEGRLPEGGLSGLCRPE